MKGSHGSGAESGFIQAQGLWDETMAENISAFLAKYPDYKMVVLAGSQHTRKDSGIPPRVARRRPVQQASVLNIYSDSAPANLVQVADYYFLAAPAQLPESPKIGIVLVTQTEENPENNQTFQKISQLSPHGKAAVAGLQVGDILTEVNNYPVSDMADLRIAMLGTKAGETIDIKVIRNKDSEDRERIFKVELTIPPSSPPLP
jgi:membrane-associated protease RseP (regulator of RpoE activity)